MTRLNKLLSLLAILLIVLVPPAQGQQVEGTSEIVSLDIQPEQSDREAAFEEALVSLGGLFRPASGDAKLDAGEEGTLQITLSNQGTKAAQNVEVMVQTSSPVEGLQIGEDGQAVSSSARSVAQVGSLAPSEARELNVPLAAPDSLPETNVELVLEATLDNGTVVGGAESITIPTGTVTTAPIVDRDIPTTSMSRPDAVAVVIGVSQYRNADIPPVDYAVRDAETIQKYLTNTLGFSPSNVLTLENPTQSELNAALGTADNHEGRLHDYLPTDTSEVFVYYSGHGAPNPAEDGRTYFLPSDASPNQLSLTGYPVDRLYTNLSKVTSGPITVAIDACFSGQSQSGTLVQNASPALLSVENPLMSLDRGLAFTASKADEVSSWYTDKRHGLFTYYFLQGLRGEADRDGDGRVLGSEMGAYLSDQVPRKARRLYSRPQHPQTLGQDTDRVLVQFDE